eukprot:1155077-Pelagomonas_calceolata.AAC.2
MERGKPSALDEQLMAAQQAHSGKTLSVEEEAARVLGQSGQEGAIREFFGGTLMASMPTG